MLSITPIGEWERARRLLAALPRDLKEVVIFSQRSVAEHYVRLVKAHLRSQDIPGWTPLSQKYAERKIAKYGSTDMLLASQEYYENIKAWREDNLYYAGVKQDVHYPNGISVARVAAIHEDWSMMPGKPYRPLWNYTLEMDLGGVKGVRDEVKNIIIRRLKQKGYPITAIKL